MILKNDNYYKCLTSGYVLTDHKRSMWTKITVKPIGYSQANLQHYKKYSYIVYYSDSTWLKSFSSVGFYNKKKV